MDSENKQFEEIKTVLGQATNGLSDEELKEEIVKLDLLAEAFLELTEKQIFAGKTLTEVIPDLISQKHRMNLSND